MKTFQNSRFAITVLVAVFMISLSGCSFHTRTHRPHRTTIKARHHRPGHHKKMNRDRNSKRYAPGRNRH